MAAAATLAVIVWQFGALPLLDRSVSQDATYELAGASDVAEFSAQVTFVPDVGEADLRVALLSADAQIASGPTALGVYGLRFRDETSRKAGVADLRVRTDVVESIEAD